MQPQDKQQFLTLITDVMAFYKQDVSRFALDVWWEACKAFDYEQVSKALTAHAKDPERGQFWPKPADIIRVLQGTRTDRARLAMSKMLDAMGRVGAYRSVVFDDPIIHAVIDDLGGWIGLCRAEWDSYSEHRFCEAYRAYAGRENITFPAKLVGEYEAVNAKDGRQIAPPVLVGDPDMAKEVLRLGATGGRTQFTLASDAIARTLIGGE